MKVTIRLSDDTVMRNCEVFLGSTQRMSDLLNDIRRFIPVIRPDGVTQVLAKDYIISVSEEKECAA
jgi:hypothetical protein